MWNPPKNYEHRPVAVLGGGVLGRRIACCWAAAGYNVTVRDPGAQQRKDAVDYVTQNAQQYAELTGKTPGTIQAFADLDPAVKDAWIVFEAVPESLHLKIETFALLQKLAPADCILASNSSSYKSSEMLDKVDQDTKLRILNTHYFMPPDNRLVELMTDGHTHPEILQFLAARHREAALIPFIARKESTGFIFNRVWAAIKREVLTILAEGVSTPEEIDNMWNLFWGSKISPCRMMDQVGLDTVTLIEQHYVHERGLPSEKTVGFLEENYLKHGKLGNKCSKGGLYPPTPQGISDGGIVLLDLGIPSSLKGIPSPRDIGGKGRLLKLSKDGKNVKTLVSGAGFPDGIALNSLDGRLYYTDMGTFGSNDGRVLSCDLDGNDLQVIIPRGGVHTPKQIAIDELAGKLYISDREGLRVVRVSLDGSNFEVIVQTGVWENPEEQADQTKWCVGMTVVPKLGKFFWTQKGPPKSGKGRILSANIDMPTAQSPAHRADVRVIFDKLPEPIDLEYDEELNSLFWTDRGEIPFGNSLNRSQLSAVGETVNGGYARFPKHEIIARNFHEAIGLKLDRKNNAIFVADLGGTLWKTDFNGANKVKVYEDNAGTFTGITLLP
ncbi:alcohol dehydrogenase [Cladophialophora psammophila CBS 110553]|uniref:Alcohol dehydrogenase n=1 Tax=Cladophialophora psammophila CBS 110553 TaxID=1182543 RepID=W9XEA4_9EURO|nr:alcohol dehydrogenase [Cladophialophora psammophila CBS 110553]EXJ75291.1 alcohol dehydrogenase [Cladophialophora psammophila CBS 110553]